MAEAKRKVFASPTSNRPRFAGGTSFVTGASNANAILRGLAKFEPSLQKYFGQTITEMETERAGKDFAAGKEPQRSSDKYMVAYAKLKGASKANELETNLTDLATNPETSPEELQAAQASMLKEMTDGRDAYFLEQFLPRATTAIGNIDLKYQKVQKAMLRERNISEVTAFFRQEFLKLKEENPEEYAKAGRKLLSDAQSIFKDLHLSRSDITGAAVTAAGQNAEINGNATWLDWADEKDKDSISTMDTEHAENVRTWRNRAEAAAKDNEAGRKDHFKKLAVQRTNEQIDRMLDAAGKNDFQAIRNELALLKTFIDPAHNSDGIQYTTEQYVRVFDMAQKLKARGQYPEYSDQTITRTLNRKGPLLEYADVRSVADRLSDNDFRYYMNQVHSNEKRKLTQEGQAFNAAIRRSMSRLKSEMHPRNALGGFFMFENGADRWREADLLFNSMVSAKQAETGKDVLSLIEVNEIEAAVTKKVKAMEQLQPIYTTQQIKFSANKHGVQVGSKENKSAITRRLEALEQAETESLQTPP